MDLTQQTIGKLRQMLDRKEVSAPELTKAYLDRIAAYDKTIQSYITVTAERAMADFIKLHGPISRSTRNLICAVLELANKAYAAGYRDGRKEVLK